MFRNLARPALLGHALEQLLSNVTHWTLRIVVAMRRTLDLHLLITTPTQKPSGKHGQLRKFHEKPTHHSATT